MQGGSRRPQNSLLIDTKIQRLKVTTLYTEDSYLNFLILFLRFDEHPVGELTDSTLTISFINLNEPGFIFF